MATTFLRALGYGSDEQVVKLFYKIEDLKLTKDMEDELLAQKVLVADVRDGEIIVARAFEPLTQAVVGQLLALGHDKVKVVDIKKDDTVIKALKKDTAHDEEEALKDIYRRLRPGDPPTVANARALLKRLFFDPEEIRSGPRRSLQDQPEARPQHRADAAHSRGKDFIAAMKYLIGLRSVAKAHWTISITPGSRRVRTVGELLANQCRVGLARTERLVKEATTLYDINVEGMTPQKLINPKALSAVIRDFFGRSQSVRVHGSNESAGGTHAQARLSARARRTEPRPRRLRGPRRASVALRPHLSHRDAGRPEHRFFISSMSTYARINDFGFISRLPTARWWTAR